jgi:hypothetical protein
MREALKVLCVVLLLFATPTSAVAWADPDGKPALFFLRYGCAVLAAGGLIGFLALHFRKDIIPDYLRRHAGPYFNRDGFCFAFRTRVIDNTCWLEILFQSQQDQACIGRVALRPARGFLLGRASMPPIAAEIQCEPAAFGVARLAIPIPAELQGKRQSFEVGASVDYPLAKGRTLRFRDGIMLRENSDFKNAFGTTLTVAGALTGSIVLSSPATTTLSLPSDVATTVSPALRPEVATLWKMGDEPIPPEQLVVR